MKLLWSFFLESMGYILQFCLKKVNIHNIPETVPFARKTLSVSKQTASLKTKALRHCSGPSEGSPALPVDMGSTDHLCTLKRLPLGLSPRSLLMEHFPAPPPQARPGEVLWVITLRTPRCFLRSSLMTYNYALKKTWPKFRGVADCKLREDRALPAYAHLLISR